MKKYVYLVASTLCITTLISCKPAQPIETTEPPVSEEIVSEEIPSEEIIEPDEQLPEVGDNTDWTTIVLNRANESQDYDTYIVKCNKCVNDEFIIADELTFKDLLTELTYKVENYPTESFRSLFSLYFMSPDSYEYMSSTSTTDSRNYLLAQLASLAADISNKNGQATEIEIDSKDPYFYKITIQSAEENEYTDENGEYVLGWEYKSGKLYVLKEDETIEYESDALSDNNIALYIVAFEDVFNSVQAPVEITEDTTCLDIFLSFGFERCKDQEEIMLEAIEDNSESPIISVKNSSYAGFERATFTTEDGKEYIYFGNDQQVYIYRSVDGSTIWKLEE